MVALGCVIRGETIHFDIVSMESARGADGPLGRAQAAVGNGILTVDTEAQAWARARVTEAEQGRRGGAGRARA